MLLLEIMRVDKDIILVDKPPGITSFDVIRRLRKALGVRKMGHAGTLDPMATGLLIVGVGEGTKKLKDLIGLPKTYEAKILLGRRTTTGDTDGEVVEEKVIGGRGKVIGKAEIKEVIKTVRGKIELPVPVYSAVKLRGKPLYKYARAGEKIAPPIKTMEVFSVKVRKVQEKEGFVFVDACFEVASGTYIRALAEEIGRRLGVPATLAALRRTKVGDFKVEDAEQLPIYQ